MWDNILDTIGLVLWAVFIFKVCRQSKKAEGQSKKLKSTLIVGFAVAGLFSYAIVNELLIQLGVAISPKETYTYMGSFEAVRPRFELQIAVIARCVGYATFLPMYIGGPEWRSIPEDS